jgi:hypothetical protein
MVRLLKALPLTLAIVGLTVFFASCGSSSSSQARFVNAIQNTANYGSGLDVEVNGTKDFTNIVFPTASASTYATVPAGSDTILGDQANTTTQVFSDSASLASGKQYTLIATGFAGGSGVVFLPETDDNTAPAAGNVNFRFINASPSGPGSVDVYVEQAPFSGNLTAGSAQVQGLAYQSASSYITLPWNSDGSGWTIIVTAAGSTIPYNGFNFDTGNIASQTTEAIRTFILTDVENGSSMSLQPIVLSDLN